MVFGTILASTTPPPLPPPFGSARAAAPDGVSSEHVSSRSRRNRSRSRRRSRIVASTPPIARPEQGKKGSRSRSRSGKKSKHKGKKPPTNKLGKYPVNGQTIKGILLPRGENDPPRSGLEKIVIEKLSKLARRAGSSGAPLDFILVSCDPAAAARDIASLLHLGFKIKNCLLVDAFAQTRHYECLTHLQY
jgi:hypothetical protein